LKHAVPLLLLGKKVQNKVVCEKLPGPTDESGKKPHELESRPFPWRGEKKNPEVLRGSQGFSCHSISSSRKEKRNGLNGMNPPSTLIYA